MTKMISFHTKAFHMYLFTIVFALLTFQEGIAASENLKEPTPLQSEQDTKRLQELDAYWQELARTVIEGDFEAYGAAYHEDAVVVFANGENKVSVPISKALKNWKPGFIATKNGEKSDHVEFRFSQRIGDASTAHETGMFHFTSYNMDGVLMNEYFVHFEMLFIKKEGKWLATMEYQKATGNKAQWEAMSS